MAQNLPQDFKEEVLKQARQQAAKWAIGGGIALAGLAITGWAFAAKPYIDNYIENSPGVSSIASVPPGAVMAFDRTPFQPCPNGWTQFKEATSRMIIGAGNTDDFYEQKFAFDEKGRKLSPRAYRQHGGEERVHLTVSEMPTHSHSTVQMIGNNSIDGVDSTTTNSGDHHNEDRSTGPAGEGEPHNNMPPFLALYYCKKQ